MASLNNLMIEITPQVLLKAYSCGIFPMAESADDPALYWIEPQFRGVLPLEAIHLSKRLRRTIRQDTFEVRVDSTFEGVIAGCAASRPGRRSTWINKRIRQLYGELFQSLPSLIQFFFLFGDGVTIWMTVLQQFIGQLVHLDHTIFL